VTSAIAATGAVVAPRPGFASRLFATWGARVAATYLAVLVIVAVFAPVFAPHDPYAIDYTAVRAAPSTEHWLGTDGSGRDILSRLIYGARVSVLVGVASMLVLLVVGTALGLIAGYRRGIVDGTIMRATDAMLSIPTLILVLALIPILGPSLFNIILAIGIIGWAPTARLVRGEVLALRERDFVTAAEVLGIRQRTILRRHILLNVLGPLTVLASFAVADAIVAESALSFLGLGIQIPQASWGQMLSAAMDFGTLQQRPWMWVSPALLIAVTVVAVAFLGDSLRDAFDPRQTST
jgi:peptide/nickel transport system permease protein